MKDENGDAIGGEGRFEEEGWYDLKYCQGKGVAVSVGAVLSSDITTWG
jgi:hypothetical protein